jgi:hypothetical protein
MKRSCDGGSNRHRTALALKARRPYRPKSIFCRDTPKSAVVVASLNHIDPNKRLTDSMRAMAAPRP